MKKRLTAVEAEKPPKPGEKAFTMTLFLLGMAAFWQSFILWLNVNQPAIASAAALPMFASLLWSALCLVVLLSSPRSSPCQTEPDTSLASEAGKGLRRAVGYALPPPLPAMIAAIAAYCAALLLHVNFYIATPLFLWGTMCYLTRRDILKNVFWTACIMGFILLIFTMIFNVVLP